MLLIAATIFCSGASTSTIAAPVSASTVTEQPPCDCQKPGTEIPAADDESMERDANIVVRMLEMY